MKLIKEYIYNDAKRILLKNFILEFLPKDKYRGKYRYNEFSNVYRTLSKLFIRKLRIRVSAEELAVCLSEGGYHCYITGKRYRRVKSIPMEQDKRAVTPSDFSDYGDNFLLFVNISSKDIRYLKRAMQSISLQKNVAEIIRIRFLKRKIKNFFNKHVF